MLPENLNSDNSAKLTRREINMNDVSQEIESMTTLKRIRKTGRPLVLTVRGKAEAVILDAKTYQGISEHMDSVARIRRGLAQVKKGLGRPSGDVFDELEREA